MLQDLANSFKEKSQQMSIKNERRNGHRVPLDHRMNYTAIVYAANQAITF